MYGYIRVHSLPYNVHRTETERAASNIFAWTPNGIRTGNPAQCRAAPIKPEQITQEVDRMGEAGRPARRSLVTASATFLGMSAPICVRA